MRTLTKAQEEIMQLVWELGECTVGHLREAIEVREGKKPPHSTVSAVILALDKRGFVKHKEYGRTFVYEAVMTREEYGRQSLGRVISNYFGGVAGRAVSQLVQNENLSLAELSEIVQKLEEE